MTWFLLLWKISRLTRDDLVFITMEDLSTHSRRLGFYYNGRSLDPLETTWFLLQWKISRPTRDDFFIYLGLKTQNHFIFCLFWANKHANDRLFLYGVRFYIPLI